MTILIWTSGYLRNAIYSFAFSNSFYNGHIWFGTFGPICVILHVTLVLQGSLKISGSLINYLSRIGYRNLNPKANRAEMLHLILHLFSLTRMAALQWELLSEKDFVVQYYKVCVRMFYTALVMISYNKLSYN